MRFLYLCVCLCSSHWFKVVGIQLGRRWCQVFRTNQTLPMSFWTTMKVQAQRNTFFALYVEVLYRLWHSLQLTQQLAQTRTPSFFHPEILVLDYCTHSLWPLISPPDSSPPSLGSLLAQLVFVVHAPPHPNDRPHKPPWNKIAHHCAHWKAYGIAITERTRGQVGSCVDQ